MSTFIFAVNAIMPIILLIILGYQLRRIGFYEEAFLKTANKFVFNVALPALLFYNVYSIDQLASMDWGVILFVGIAIFVLFGLGLLTVMIGVKDPCQKGVILQCVFRSNYAIIGIPLAEALGGKEAVAIAAVISAFSIPIYNILAVISLSIFKEDEGGKKTSVKDILKGICKNPLILGVGAGLICLVIRGFLPYNEETGTYVFSLKEHLAFLYKAIKNLSLIASPLALIVLGGQFKFTAVKTLAREIIIGTVWRLVLAPGLALGVALLLSKYTSIIQFTAVEYPALIALFGTPVAVSSAIMAGQMGSDEELAGQLVVWTSLLSIFTLFISIVIARDIGML